jgi:hypothetical protein
MISGEKQKDEIGIFYHRRRSSRGKLHVAFLEEYSEALSRYLPQYQQEYWELQQFQALGSCGILQPHHVEGLRTFRGASTNRRTGPRNPTLGRMCFLQDFKDIRRQDCLSCSYGIDCIEDLDEKAEGFFQGCEAEESVVWWRSVDVVNLNHSKFDREIDTKMENKVDICNP